jgi:predicted metal-binding protein
MAGKRAVNYSIEGIAQSIVRDSKTGKEYGPDEKKKLYEERLQFLGGFPELKRLLTLEHIHDFRLPWAKRVARLAILPPEIIVVDSRIQDMCYLPFWTYYGSGEGSFARCAGIGNFSCCPPFNLKAEKVQALLDKSQIFVAFQTKPTAALASGNPGQQFAIINKLAAEVNSLMGKGAVVQKFAGGPCFACYPEVCDGEGTCKAPELKIPALEGMGICVDQLCKDAALLTGDKNWKITWIKGFGAPDQTPKRWKGTVGLAIKAAAD